jgi:hypothetical protein
MVCSLEVKIRQNNLVCLDQNQKRLQNQVKMGQPLIQMMQKSRLQGTGRIRIEPSFWVVVTSETIKA